MTKKLLIGAVSSIMLLVGCQSEKLEIYSSDEYSLEYPSSYSVEEANESFKALTVRGEKGRVEIFKMNDFGDRPSGFTGEETQEDIDDYVPKEQLKVADYDVWLFYSENDAQTKSEVQDIAESIEAPAQP